MTDADALRQLDAYHFHEEEWDDLDELRDAFEWSVPDEFNLATYVCDAWAGTGRTALVQEDEDGVEEHTFADLQALANRFANHLEDQGVGPGDRVAVHGAQRVEVLATHVAVWSLGAASIPISVLFGPDALGYRLGDSGAAACVATREGLEAFRAVRDEVPSLETSVVVDVEPEAGETSFTQAVEGRSPDRETAATAPDDTAVVIYTSGTTGDPKGVVLPHQHLLGILPTTLCSVYNLEVRDDDVLRTPVEWSWAGSIIDIVLPALAYGRPVVAADLGPFDPETELDLLARHGVTITGGPPTAYRMLLGHPAAQEADLDDLRVLALGGEAAGDALMDLAGQVLPQAAVHEVYGQSEAPLFAGDCEALGVEHRSGKMGRPAPGHEVQVLDPDTQEPMGAGEVGELALRREGNPICFTGYWNKPEETDRKVVGGWQLSEDLGIVDEDGFLEFHSRKDDIIMSSGYKVSPAEVEDALAGHDAVVNVGVVGVPDETRGELIKAFVALTEGYEPSGKLEAELQGYVKDHLASYEYPRELEFVEELPKTTTGKVRRRDLRAREGLLDGE